MLNRALARRLPVPITDAEMTAPPRTLLPPPPVWSWLAAGHLTLTPLLRPAERKDERGEK